MKDHRALDAIRKAINLDQFAAPAFSGMVFVESIVAFGRHELAAAIFMLSAVLGYWSRAIYLFWKQSRCIAP